MKSIPAYAAASVAAIAAGVIAGWLFEFEPLMDGFAGMVRMKPNTAVAFLLAATALYLAYKRKYRAVQAFCASMVFIIAVVTLIEFLAGINAHVDEILFYDPVPSPFPGRMAHFSAALFLASGAMLYPLRSKAYEKVKDALALIIGFGSVFAIVGFLYGVPLFYGSIAYTAMSIYTGLGFLILSLGFLFIPRGHGLARIFRAPSVGGEVARRLVPAAILIPIIVGAVFNRFNFGQLRLGIAFIVLCDILLTVAAIWTLAFILDTSEIAREVHQQAAEIDGLTGIQNRRYFDRRLKEEIQRCLRYSRESCLILFDIDHFKSLNDLYGHPCGDAVLHKIAQTCRQSLRTTDVVCRYGGEEFAIIVPETTALDGMALARKIRKLVRLLHFDKVLEPVTISSGVASIGKLAPSSEAAIAAADQALYLAKKLGRNRECSYNDVEMAVHIACD